MTSKPELSSQLLSQIVRSELRHGNQIRGIETGWSRMDTVIRFARPLSLLDLPADWADSGGRTFAWEDPHGGREAGLIVGHEAVVGPVGD